MGSNGWGWWSWGFSQDAERPWDHAVDKGLSALALLAMFPNTNTPLPHVSGAPTCSSRTRWHVSSRGGIFFSPQLRSEATRRPCPTPDCLGHCRCGQTLSLHSPWASLRPMSMKEELASRPAPALGPTLPQGRVWVDHRFLQIRYCFQCPGLSCLPECPVNVGKQPFPGFFLRWLAPRLRDCFETRYHSSSVKPGAAGSPGLATSPA
jgi:hypothetical protein